MSPETRKDALPDTDAYRERERVAKEKAADAFEKAPTDKKIRFVEFLLKNETDPAKRQKLLSFLDHLSDKKHSESKNAESLSETVLPDGKSVRVENGEIVIGGNEKAPEKFDSSRLVARVTDEAGNLSQFKKIEPFLKTFFREGIVMDKATFEDVAVSLSYALRALSDELEPQIVKGKSGTVPDRRNIDLYDPNTTEPAALAFRKTVADLNAKYFNDKASPFRMRP
ncbi:MAG: hypothetical protein QMC36_06975 [Patescibacteria group bacterium]